MRHPTASPSFLVVAILMAGLLATSGARAAKNAPSGSRSAAAARKAAGPRATTAPKTSPALPQAKPGAAGRTLDDIHIEGEIPVPQVLFITARDQRRFMEFQHRHYLRTSREIGESTVIPSRIVVTRARPDARKEIER